MRLLTIAVLEQMVIVSGASAAPTPSVSQVPPLRLGVAYGDELVWASRAELTDALDSAVRVGVRWIRVDLSWADIQWDGPTVYLWSRFDRVVAAARARNLQILAVLAYTPPWARVPGCGTESCPPADPTAFATFAAEAARRYGSSGVHAWEIWNEPNGAGFWAPRPSADRYSKLLSVTSEVIKRVHPDSTIVLGGLAPLPSRNGNIDATTFLARLGTLGALQRVDAVGYHPYTYPYLASFKAPWRTSWNMIDSTSPRGLRATLRRYQRPNLPIWLTEYGAPTNGPGTPSDGSPRSITKDTTHVTEKRQAEIAADAVRAAAGDQTIGALIWYSDRDLAGRTSSNEGFYGLRRSDGARKPAFDEMRRAVTGVDAVRRRG